MRFIDREQVLDDLHHAASQARAAHPEILRVFLFGSPIRDNWTDALAHDPASFVAQSLRCALEL